MISDEIAVIGWIDDCEVTFFSTNEDNESDLREKLQIVGKEKKAWFKG